MNNRLTRNDTKNLSLASLGGALEFYDFIVFLTYIPVLKVLFFPEGSGFSSLFTIYGIYAIAYFVRPLSGIIIAHFGDLVGRKKMFMLSLFLMAIPTLCIGFLPTYKDVGYLAPVLLLLLRVLQGIALGGEVPSAHVFVTEHVTKNHIGLANSMVAAGLTFGVVIGHFVAAIMNGLFSEAEILSYAWRFPFILGGGLGLFAVYLRRHLRETPVFLAFKEQKRLSAEFPIKRVFAQYKEATLVAIVSTWLLIAGVVLVLLTPNLMKSELFNIDAQFVNKIALIAALMNIIGSVIAGILADRIGIKKTLGLFALGLSITSFIFFQALGQAQLVTIAWLYIVAALFLGIVACVPIIIVRLYPAEIRLTGMSFSYNIGNAFFAGLTTFLVPVIAQGVHPMFIAYYMLFLCALGIGMSFYLNKKSLKFYV